MNTQDVRWQQRFSHFCKALSQLQEAVELAQSGSLSRLEEQGLIQGFEYTYELSWNTIKDYYEAQGETQIQGSRDAFRLAFRRGLVKDGHIWMDMIKSRMLTTHTYDEAMAKEIATSIINAYYPQFIALQIRLQQLLKEQT